MSLTLREFKIEQKKLEHELKEKNSIYEALWEKAMRIAPEKAVIRYNYSRGKKIPQKVLESIAMQEAGLREAKQAVLEVEQKIEKIKIEMMEASLREEQELLERSEAGATPEVLDEARRVLDRIKHPRYEASILRVFEEIDERHDLIEDNVAELRREVDNMSSLIAGLRNAPPHPMGDSKDLGEGWLGEVEGPRSDLHQHETPPADVGPTPIDWPFIMENMTIYASNLASYEGDIKKAIRLLEHREALAEARLLLERNTNLFWDVKRWLDLCRFKIRGF